MISTRAPSRSIRTCCSVDTVLLRLRGYVLRIGPSKVRSLGGSGSCLDPSPHRYANRFVRTSSSRETRGRFNGLSGWSATG